MAFVTCLTIAFIAGFAVVRKLGDAANLLI